MKSVKEILTSPYRGSDMTREMVREQLRQRYGDEVADEFDPTTDAMPYSSWLSHGYRVRPGEKALKSVTYLEIQDDNEKMRRKIRRNINLFHKRQVSRIE